MTTLSEFLLERLAEDEAVAQAASQSEWAAVSDNKTHKREGIALVGLANRRGQGEGGCIAVLAGGGPDAIRNRHENAEHIARHDPARVLADVEAKRRIVARYQNAAGMGLPPDYTGDLGVYVAGLEFACRNLASIYADHPDYRQEWTP